MDPGGVNIVIFAVLTTGAVLIVIQLGRLLQAGMQHKTIREAISRDSTAVPDLLAGVEREQRPAGANDDRTAMVLIAIGLALFVFAMIQGDLDDIRNIGGAAIFPIFVGIALLLRQYLVKRRGRQS
jgi:Na+/H+-dicarboxylate symporter